jgi:hypothetical protein
VPKHAVCNEFNKGRGFSGTRRPDDSGAYAIGKLEYGALGRIELHRRLHCAPVTLKAGDDHASTVLRRGDTNPALCAHRERLTTVPALCRNLSFVDIRIGIANSPREISFESTQTSVEVEKIIADALDSNAKFVKLRDDKGKFYIVPTVSLSYIEVGSEESRRIGFVA